MPTAQDLYSAKPGNLQWARFFKPVFENGLLSENACNLLGIVYVKTVPYVKNGHFPVADITLKRLKSLDAKNIQTPNIELMSTIISMISPAVDEPQPKYRERCANQMIRFVESNLSISHKGKPIMGGNLNDLLTLYFEKITRKFVTKAKSGKDCLARIHEIRAACSPDTSPESEPETMAEPVPETMAEPIVTETTFVDDRDEVPDDWDV